MEIIWDHPSRLLALWALVPLGFLLWFGRHGRQLRAEQFLSSKMAPRLLPEFRSGRWLLQSLLWLIAVTCLCIAMAGPRWGVAIETVTQRGADLIVALDVSRSMLSRDVTPSRIDRARSDLLDLLKKLEGDRVGLVAFAGKASVVCPLTTDQGFFQLALDEVGPHSVSIGGTAIGDAIRTCLDNMEHSNERDQAIVLITDGEDHDSFPEEAAAMAADREVRIFCIGLGDASEGSRVPAADDSGFMKFEGQEVWSKMDESLLKTIAATTQGAYVPAQTLDYDLGQIYEEHLASLRGGEFATEQRKRHKERFQVFVAAGLLALLLELFLTPKARRLQGLAAAWLLVSSGPSWGQDTPTPSVLVDQGLEHLANQRWDQAIASLQAAQKAAPEQPIIAFNLGCAHAAAGQPDPSRLAYLEAAKTKDPSLIARAQYNLGELESDQARTLFGEDPAAATPEMREQGLAMLETAIRHYRSCLEMDAEHADARHNLELIRLWIKHMEHVWAERDKQEDNADQEPDPVHELYELATQSRQLWFDGIQVAEQADSAERRVAMEAVAQQHETLAEAIEPIKQQILEQFDAQANPASTAPGTPSPPPPDDEQLQAMQQARTFLEQALTAAATAQREAAAEFRTSDLTASPPQAKNAATALLGTWSALSQFSDLLQHMLKDQEQVVEPLASHDPTAPATDDWQIAAELQSPIGDLTPLMVAKAKQQLEQMQAMSGANPAASDDPGVPQLAPAQEDPPPSPTPAPPANPELEEQLAKLQKAVELAEQYEPEIINQSALAHEQLLIPAPEQATPAAQESLRMLQEIAEQLPQSPSQNSQQGQDPQDGEQDQQDSEEQTDDSKSEENEQQEQDSQEPQSQDPSSGSQDEQAQPNEPQPMTPEQMEALLQLAAEQEREAKERRDKVRGVLVAPRKAKRDW